MADHFFFKKEDGSRDVRITASGYQTAFGDRIVSINVSVSPGATRALCSLHVKGEAAPREFLLKAEEMPAETLKTNVWQQYPEQLLRHAAVRMAFEATFPAEVKALKEALLGSPL